MMDMSIETPAPVEKPPGKLFLPSLAIALFSVNITNATITIVAVDIAKTFFDSANASAVAAVSQLNTVNAVAEVIFALLLSILAIRFRHKPLLLVGVIFVVISAVGSFLAPTLLSLMLFNAVEGIGSIIVTVLAFTVLGDSLPANKKTNAISYLRTVGPAAGLVGTFLIGFITNFGGWRSNFLFLALPASAAGLILTSFVLPSKPREKPAANKQNPYVRSFKQVFTNRSATALLVASLLTVAGTQVAIFAIAFYRTQFGVPRDWTVGIVAAAAAMLMLSPLVAAPLVKKFGAKRIAVSSALLTAFFTMTFFFIPNFWGCLVLDMLHVWFTGIAGTAFVCLIIDQVPKSRGTMLSLSSFFDKIGYIIAPAVGGALLVLTDGLYGAIGLALGMMTIAGALILFLFAKDPNQPQKTPGSLEQ